MPFWNFPTGSSVWKEGQLNASTNIFLMTYKLVLLSYQKKPNTKFMTGTAAAAKSLQSCPTLCDPIDGSPPGSPVPGILQARTLE